MSDTSIQRIYNSISKEFNTTRRCHWESVKKFLDSLPAYSVVGDCGCGNGKYINYRSDLFVIGSDISDKLAQMAQKGKNEIFICNNLNLSYRDKSVDYSISIAVMHHLKHTHEHVQFIQELLRITRKEILITVWAYEQKIKDNWVCENHHDFLIPWKLGMSAVLMRPYHLFSKDEIEHLCSVELKLVFDLTFEKNNWIIKIASR